jgi:uncharacterized membrane protein
VVAGGEWQTLVALNSKVLLTTQWILGLFGLLIDDNAINEISICKIMISLFRIAVGWV